MNEQVWYHRLIAGRTFVGLRVQRGLGDPLLIRLDL